MVARKFLMSALALLSVSLLISDAQAQNQPPAGGGRRPGQGQGGGRGQYGGQGIVTPQLIGSAFNAVNPTPEQKQKFEDLQIRLQQEMQGMRGQGGAQGDRSAMMQKRQEIMTKFRNDTEALLTPEQKTKFQEELKKRQTPEGRLMGVLDPLNLTPEQKTRIEPIAKESAAAMQAAMTDQNMEMRDRFEKSQQLFDEFKAKVRPNLTPEQQSKLDTIDYRSMIGGGRGQRP